MLTPEKINTLSTFTANGLTRAINLAGYKNDTFSSVRFVGISTPHLQSPEKYDFHYKTDWTNGDEVDTVMVYVSFFPETGKVEVDY
jgi:hypothetical protein